MHIWQSAKNESENILALDISRNPNCTFLKFTLFFGLDVTITMHRSVRGVYFPSASNSTCLTE